MTASWSRAPLRRRAALVVGGAAASAYAAVAGCSSPSHGGFGTSAQAVGSAGLVISGVYGGGGNAGATFSNDFVELFNRGTSAVSLQGMSLQYGSATADFTSVVVLPNVTVAPGRYFLVQLASGGFAAGALPTPDLANSAVNLGATSGKVALASVTSALGCGGATRCNTANVVDMVGYGTATDFEGPTGSAVGPLSNTSGAYRRAGGCTDTDVNFVDFVITSPVTAPRNQSTAAAPCGGGVDAGVDTSVVDSAPPDDAAPDGSTGTDSGPPSPGDGAGLVISQVYGGGGPSGARSRSFVELFNRSGADVATTGLSLQVAGASGDFGASGSDVFALPNLIIPTAAFVLVGIGREADAGTPLPPADLDAPTLALDAVSGKVALAKITTGLGCGGTTRCPPANVVDLVGYGAASDYEGSGAAPALSGTTSALRKEAGCADARSNVADFEVASPNPRTIITPRTPCAGSGGGSTSGGSSGGSPGGGGSLPPPGGGSRSGDAGFGAAGVPPDIATPSDTGGCNAAGRPGGEGALVLGALGVALARRRRRD